MSCQPAVWPLWPCEVRAGDRVAHTPRMQHDSNREVSQMEKPYVFPCLFSFFIPLCACFMGARIFNSSVNLFWLTLLGISICLLDWMPMLRLWKQLPSLRVFFWSLSDTELPSSNGRLSSHIPDWLWKRGLEARCCLFGRFALLFLTEGSAVA